MHSEKSVASFGVRPAPETPDLLSTMIPVASLTGVGFAFSGYDKVWAAMDGDMGSYIRQAIEKLNLHPFQSLWDNGFREITTSNRPRERADRLDAAG